MVDEIAREKWDQRHAKAPPDQTPARVLEEYAHFLPGTGQALDLACGHGANALFLARKGLDVQAWDLSATAIAALRQQADRENLVIETYVRDVCERPPSPESFDVICVSFYLERSITGHIRHALRLGGLLYYQTFIHEQVTDHGPSNPAYRLGPNELLELFAPLHVLVFREEGRTGDPGQGLRDIACLVAQQRTGRSASYSP